MALAVGRNGCRRFVGVASLVSRQTLDGRHLAVLGGTVHVHVATLKATYGEKYPYAKPFPYEKKRFGFPYSFWEKTIPRFNENTKVIVVEGNVGVGKKEFAQNLAKDFDLKYFPATPELVCFNQNWFDYDERKLDNLLPESTRAYDLMKLYSDPHPEVGKAGRLQMAWYMAKFDTYCDALKHLLSTGQGVVMDQSVYSDIVYVDALRSMGWLTPNFVNYYHMLRDNSICELFRPHMTVYLDAPISVLKQRIAEKNDPVTKGKNFTENYLQAIDNVYKKRFLPKMRESGEVIEIDWTEKGNEMDMDIIAEEMQTLKLEGEDNDDVKFGDWSRQDEDSWAKFRLLLDVRFDELDSVFTRPFPWDCPELYAPVDDIIEYQKVVDSHPVLSGEPGWSPELGHSVLFNIGKPVRRSSMFS